MKYKQLTNKETNEINNQLSNIINLYNNSFLISNKLFAYYMSLNGGIKITKARVYFSLQHFNLTFLSPSVEDVILKISQQDFLNDYYKILFSVFSVESSTIDFYNCSKLINLNLKSINKKVTNITEKHKNFTGKYIDFIIFIQDNNICTKFDIWKNYASRPYELEYEDFILIEKIQSFYNYFNSLPEDDIFNEVKNILNKL